MANSEERIANSEDRTGRPFLRSSIFALLTSLFAWTLAAFPDQPIPNESSGKKPADFAPGVRIDWSARAVEVDGVIVLREGPLELFACSPRTREHESIIAVKARPMHVFQAMGLIGLEPGSPVRYDAECDRPIPPRGETLDLAVRYGTGDEARVIPLETWMLDVSRRRPPEPIEWVFAGSRTFDNGRFGADADGTVICVVDFDTALIAVGSLHTADNEQLWLTANTEAIPPIDTPCTILIRSARPPAIVVELTSDGKATLDGGKPIAVPALLDELTRQAKNGVRRKLTVNVGSGVPAATVAKLVSRITDLGWARETIEVHGAEAAKPDVPVRP